MRRFRREDGIALPVALAVMMVVMLLVGVAVAYSLHSIQRSNRDRGQARALAAAQAGVDVARWRMNKSIVADQFSGILSTNGLLTNVVQTLGCTNLTVNGSTLLGGNWCAGSQEILQGSTTGGTANETYQYYTDLSVGLDLQAGLNLGHLANGLVTRKIVSIGTATGQTARIEGVTKLDLNNLLVSGNALRLWTLGRVVQCPSSGFTASSPDQGCPSV